MKNKNQSIITNLKNLKKDIKTENAWEKKCDRRGQGRIEQQEIQGRRGAHEVAR